MFDYPIGTPGDGPYKVTSLGLCSLVTIFVPGCRDAKPTTPSCGRRYVRTAGVVRGFVGVGRKRANKESGWMWWGVNQVGGFR